MAKKSTKTASKKPTASKAAPAMEALFKPFQQAGQGYGFEQAKEQMEKLGLKLDMFKGSDDWTRAGQENLEAFIKSSQILARSAEDLSKALAEFAQTSMEMSTKASQTLMGVKSLQDLAEVQSGLAKDSLEHFIAGASRLSDMTMKVANEAMEPISARVNKAVEKLSKSAA